MSDSAVSTSSSLELDKLSQQINGSDKLVAWKLVATEAKVIADALRDKTTTAIQDTLGKSQLPDTLTSLMRAALDQSEGIPGDCHAEPLFEIMRIGANFCSDHDHNRKSLLEAGLLAAIITLLERYNHSVASIPSDRVSKLSQIQLQLVKTAVGCILNATIGFEPVKSELRSLKTLETLLQLASTIYPAQDWVKDLPWSENPSEAESLWSIRATLSNWSWREITELREDTPAFLGPDILRFLTPPLRVFTRSYSQVPETGTSAAFTSLLQADFDVLEESCSLLESLCLDVDDVRLSLARGLVFPEEHHGVKCFSDMLDFIEDASYPTLWTSFAASERAAKERSFDFFKAAVIKSVVEVAAEEKNADVLWDAGEDISPGGVFVCRMVQWIRSFADAPEKSGREDLAICATLTLANLATRESFSKTLLSPPHAIASLLSPMIAPTYDLRVRHGVLGLLKHLTQSSNQSLENRKLIEDQGVIAAIVKSGIWDDTKDALAEVVQMNAFGIVKHLCNGSLSATFDMALPSDKSSATGVTQVMALIQRSDAVAIKSEGTRILVNMIKTLWSADKSSESNDEGRREQAVKVMLTPGCADALARLIGRSMKYPLLVNEAVVAMSLMATQESGAAQVLAAISSVLPIEASASGPSGITVESGEAPLNSNPSSPVVISPSNSTRVIRRQADQLLIAVLKNFHGTHRTVPVSYPPEVRLNICSLFAQIVKRSPGESGESFKVATKPVLEELSKISGSEGKEAMLSNAAAKTLQMYGPSA